MKGVINLLMRASDIELTAKKSHYGIDGTGRDTYINFDNGGNFRGHSQLGIGKFQRGQFPTPGRGRINSSYVPVQGKPLHYVGNGTGRDTYIIATEGGIVKNDNSRHNFLGALRAPIRRQQIAPKDIYSKTQAGWLGQNKSQTRSGYQRNLDRKLSEHRQYNDPYHAMRSTFRDSMRKGL